MRRADRLFALTGILRGGGTYTAAALAQATQVSERTIWRDMELLSGAGLPVTGTRGQGYRLGERVPLPPLALSALELEALRLGLDTVAAAADPELRPAARELLARIEDALPGHGSAHGSGQIGSGPAAHGSGLELAAGGGGLGLAARGGGLGLAAFARAAEGFAHMPLLRRAIRERLVLRLSHHAPGRDEAERDIRPLRMDYLGGLWSLTAWCELRQDFRVFQVERLRSPRAEGRSFAPEPGKRIEDYLARFLGGPDGN